MNNANAASRRLNYYRKKEAANSSVNLVMEYLCIQMEEVEHPDNELEVEPHYEVDIFRSSLKRTIFIDVEDKNRLMVLIAMMKMM